MSALTPSAVYRESVGSMTLNVVTFASVSTSGDTWTLPTIFPFLWAWAVGTTGGASASSGGIDVAYATSGTGTVITIDPLAYACPVTLFVLART